MHAWARVTRILQMLMPGDSGAGAMRQHGGCMHRCMVVVVSMRSCWLHKPYPSPTGTGTTETLTLLVQVDITLTLLVQVRYVGQVVSVP